MLAAPIFGDINPQYLFGRTYDPRLGGLGLAYFISNVIDAVMIAGGLAFFAYLAIGGLRYITASGDAKQTQDAQKQITNALMGLAIVVGAFAITRVVGAILGIDIFKPVFKGP